MNLKVIEKDLNDYCKQKNLNLFEVSYSKKDETLSIILDEQLDMDKLEEVSNDLSTYMDKYDDDFEENYILDVSTVGVERPIRNAQEMVKAINEYIYVKTKDEEIYGYLRKFENDVLSIEYKEKTKDKIKNIEYSKVKKVRYAVKF